MRGRLNVMQAVRFTAAEADAVRNAAEFHGITVSAYIREHVIPAATRAQVRLNTSHSRGHSCS